MNECTTKIKANIPESHSFRDSQFHIFFVRCRRTYVLNNITFIISFTRFQATTNLIRKYTFFKTISYANGPGFNQHFDEETRDWKNISEVKIK